MGVSVLIAAVVVVCLAYQAYVTMRVIAYPNSTGFQQVLQIGLVWFLPVVGALIVHAFFKLDTSPPRSRDPAFTPESGHDGGSDVGH